MQSRLWYALIVAFCCLVTAGCDVLGLDDDDDGNGTPAPTPPPELVVPEPIDSFPVPQVLYYKGQDNSNPLDPKTFVYSYLFDSRTVLRLNNGISTFIKPLKVPLGRSRFSEGFVVLYENSRFFLGRSDEDVVAQITTFQDTLCETGGYRLHHDGVGYLNAFLVAWTAGDDTLCGTDDDIFSRVNMSATPTDEPETISPIAYQGTPFHDVDNNLSGWLLEENGGISVYDTDFELARRFDSLTDSTVSEPVRYGAELLMAIDGQLILTDSESLIDGSAVIPIFSLNNNVLDENNTQISGETLWIADGTQLVTVDLASQTGSVLATLGGIFTPQGRLQQGTGYLYLRGTDNGLYRIDKDTGSIENLIAAGTELIGPFLAVETKLYWTTRDLVASLNPSNNLVQRLKARVMDEADAQGPLCEDEGVSSDQPGCTTYARWTIFKRFTDSGVSYLPMQLKGKQTQIERDNVVTVFEAQEGQFFNSTDAIVYVPETGEPQITVGTIGNYTQLQGTGIMEVTHGLMTFITSTDPLADMYYFDTKAARSFRLTSRTVLLSEEIINASPSQ